MPLMNEAATITATVVIAHLKTKCLIPNPPDSEAVFRLRARPVVEGLADLKEK
jgi:hypothetical protein